MYINAFLSPLGQVDMCSISQPFTSLDFDSFPLSVIKWFCWHLFSISFSSVIISAKGKNPQSSNHILVFAEVMQSFLDCSQPHIHNETSSYMSGFIYLLSVGKMGFIFSLFF